MLPPDSFDFGPPFYITVTLQGKPVEVMVKDFMFSVVKCDYLVSVDGGFRGYIYKGEDGVWDSIMRYTDPMPQEDLQVIGAAIEAAGYTKHKL